ncbi:MAG: hypothetical protein HY064_05995 [Bacteroidetes bacterium]|nr:hypothetical protein [Bacteroidota bacterium]
MVIFFGLALVGILHHELWLDEAHHWLLARDSHSIGELFYNARYDGHPLLWDLLLFVITRFTHDPFWMQFAHILISSIAVFLFMRYSPFSFYACIIIVFGYFIFYEYTVISRNYGLIFLAMTVVAILYPQRKNKLWLFALALAFLALTHLFACALAGVLLMMEFSESIYGNENKIAIKKIIPLCLVLGVLFFVGYEAHPPSDHFLYRYDTDAYFSFKRIGKAFSILWKGFFPLPDMSCDHPWNSNWVISLSKTLAVLPSAAVWILPYFILTTKKTRLLFYSAALLVACFVFFSPLMVASRHCGVLFLFLLFAIWINEDEKKLMTKPGKMLFYSVLLVQLISGIFMYAWDFRNDFSASKKVTDWIKKNKMDKEFIVVHDHSTGPPIAAYLDRNLWYAENNNYESFCRWNTIPFIIPQDVLLGKLIPVSNDLGKGGLLITNKMLRQTAIDSAPALHLHPLIFFEKSGTRSETYFIYEFHR